MMGSVISTLPCRGQAIRRLAGLDGAGRLELRAQRRRPVQETRLGDAVGDIDELLDRFSGCGDPFGDHGELRLIPGHALGHVHAQADVRVDDMDDTEVLPGLGACGTDAIAVGLLERRVEARPDLLEPLAGLVELPGEQDLLLRRECRQLGDGQFGELGRHESEFGHRGRPHANTRSPVPRRSAWRSYCSMSSRR
jgi:hypothetical protein